MQTIVFDKKEKVLLREEDIYMLSGCLPDGSLELPFIADSRLSHTFVPHCVSPELL